MPNEEQVSGQLEPRSSFRLLITCVQFKFIKLLLQLDSMEFEQLNILPPPVLTIQHPSTGNSHFTLLELV